MNSMSIRVGSFNILDPLIAEQTTQKEGIDASGKSNWKERQNRIIKLIKDSNLDVLCLQEISKKTLKDLSQQIAGLGYEIGNALHLSHDGIAILYKKNRFDLDGFDYYLVQDKVVYYVELHDKTLKKTIRVGNCHLSPGKNGDQQIEKLFDQMNSPMNAINELIDLNIIAGDFQSNQYQYLKALKNQEKNLFSQLINNQYQTDYDSTKQDYEPSQGTFIPSQFNSYSEDISLTNINGKDTAVRKSDWIFVRPSNNEIQLELDSTLVDDQSSRPVSDRASNHHLIATKIIFQNSSSKPLPLSSSLSNIKNFVAPPSGMSFMPLNSLDANFSGMKLTGSIRKNKVDASFELQNAKILQNDAQKLAKAGADHADVKEALQKIDKAIKAAIEAEENITKITSLAKSQIKITELTKSSETTKDDLKKIQQAKEDIILATKDIKKALANPNSSAANSSKPNNNSPAGVQSKVAGNSKTALTSKPEKTFLQSISGFFRSIGQRVWNFVLKIPSFFGYQKKKK